MWHLLLYCAHEERGGGETSASTYANINPLKWFSKIRREEVHIFFTTVDRYQKSAFSTSPSKLCGVVDTNLATLPMPRRPISQMLGLFTNKAKQQQQQQCVLFQWCFMRFTPFAAPKQLELPSAGVQLQYGTSGVWLRFVNELPKVHRHSQEHRMQVKSIDQMKQILTNHSTHHN